MQYWFKPNTAAFALIAILVAPGMTQAGVVTLVPSDDTVLVRNQVQANQGTYRSLAIQPNPDTQRALVKFDLSGLSITANDVRSAQLVLGVEFNDGKWSNQGNAGQIALHRMLSNWNEASASWACTACAAPWSGGHFSTNPINIVDMTHIVSGNVQLDVTADIKHMISSRQNYGWMIKKVKEDKSGP